MSIYKLHCFGQSGNAYKVALYLNCSGLEWEPVFVDFMNGATRDLAWRAMNNPMGEVPVLEVDGRRLTQSGAILSYLAEETGKFAPVKPEDKYEALRWVLFDNHKFSSYFATHRFLNAFPPDAPDPAVMAFLKSRATAAFKVVDKHLDDKHFMLGENPTIADFSLAGYMFYPVEETGIDVKAEFPCVGAWIDRMSKLPGWKDPYDLMPGERIPPRDRSS